MKCKVGGKPLLHLFDKNVLKTKRTNSIYWNVVVKSHAVLLEPGISEGYAVDYRSCKWFFFFLLSSLSEDDLQGCAWRSEPSE